MASTRWALVCLGLSACGTTIANSPPDRPPPLGHVEAVRHFDDALKELAARDRDNDWTAEACERLARDFTHIAHSTQGRAQDSAWFNVGVSRQRCSQDAAAEKAFRMSSSNRAQAELVLYRHAAGASLDATIADLERVIRKGEYRNLRALVALAALQMKRGASGDAREAMSNLQRALAIDDTYVPAANQLALYYLHQAQPAPARGLVLSGEERPAARRQQMDLAALVVSQAMKKNDRYAPLHNTAGLVAMAQGDYGAAARSFDAARKLDPRFFEAHMNYAATSFAIRGFARAEQAYRAAVKLSPGDYDAHLGLALALRAQATVKDRARLTEARAELARARQIDPARPEAYYNEAVLVEEFEAKGAPGKRAIPVLRKAQKLYREFGERADARVLGSAVKRAQERSADIDATISFLEQGQ